MRRPPDKEEPAPEDGPPDTAAATATDPTKLPATIPAGLDGIGQERLRAVRMLASAISDDASRQVGHMVDKGWPLAEARAATGRWWSSVALVAIRDGLAEGEHRARAA